MPRLGYILDHPVGPNVNSPAVNRLIRRFGSYTKIVLASYRRPLPHWRWGYHDSHSLRYMCKDRLHLIATCEVESPLNECGSRSGNYHSYRMLLSLGANMYSSGDDDWTPLNEVVLQCNLIRLLVGFGVDVNYREGQHRSNLHIAALHGALSSTRLLLSAGANIYAESWEKQTPLHLAAMNDFVKIVELLLEYGADPSCVDIHGETAFDYAQENSGAVAKLLLEHN